VLEHLGIYKMLGYESAIIPTREDVVRWRHCHATSTVLDEAGALIEMSQQLDRQVSKRLFGGLSEAVANVADHAYIGVRKDGIRTDAAKTWWMFCREMDDSLAVCVCDLGVGIPGSLPLKYPAELIREFVDKVSKGRRPHDGRLIQSAMALARSRTNEDHRGKGFRDMRSVVDATPGATLHVFSNRGMLRYKSGREKARAYQDSILGTVVIWSLPFTETEVL
jgi:anti-sigma regulatory factor (Ser/Thr protein kinase)